MKDARADLAAALELLRDACAAACTITGTDLLDTRANLLTTIKGWREDAEAAAQALAAATQFRSVGQRAKGDPWWTVEEHRGAKLDAPWLALSWNGRRSEDTWHATAAEALRAVAGRLDSDDHARLLMMATAVERATGPQ
jgi:hypothetical protein